MSLGKCDECGAPQMLEHYDGQECENCHIGSYSPPPTAPGEASQEVSEGVDCSRGGDGLCECGGGRFIDRLMSHSDGNVWIRLEGENLAQIESLRGDVVSLEVHRAPLGEGEPWCAANPSPPEEGGPEDDWAASLCVTCGKVLDPEQFCPHGDGEVCIMEGLTKRDLHFLRLGEKRGPRCERCGGLGFQDNNVDSDCKRCSGTGVAKNYPPEAPEDGVRLVAEVVDNGFSDEFRAKQQLPARRMEPLIGVPDDFPTGPVEILIRPLSEGESNG